MNKRFNKNALGNKRSLISIGAGKNQFKLIRMALELGYHVIAVDQNLAVQCKLKNLEYLRCSTYDSDQVLKKLKERFQNHLPTGLIYRTSGPAIRTAGLVAQAFKISSPSYKSALASYAKSQLFKDCSQTNVKTPFTKTFSDFPHFIDDWENWVIKPDAPIYGKKNVYLPSTTYEAVKAFQAALFESDNNLVNIQSYIKGTNLSAMAFCHKNRCQRIICFDEWVEVNHENGINGLGVTFPSIITSKKTNLKISCAIDKLLKYWVSDNGIIFFTFRVDHRGIPWLYEVNLGLSGDAVAEKLLPAVFGITFDQLCKIDIKLNCGEFSDLPDNGTPVGIIRNKAIYGENLSKFLNGKIESADR